MLKSFNMQKVKQIMALLRASNVWLTKLIITKYRLWTQKLSQLFTKSINTPLAEQSNINIGHLENVQESAIVIYKKEIALIIVIFIISGILLISIIILNRLHINKRFLSPFGQSFGLLSFIFNKEKPGTIVYGYIPFWNMDKAKYIQMDRITDIAYFGLNLDSNGTFKDDGAYYIWRESKTLKELIENSTKHNTRFAVTIISHDDEITDSFLDCTQCWVTFADTLRNEQTYHNITDINLNFEYSEYTTQDKVDKFTQFVKYVREEFPDAYLVVSSYADAVVKSRLTDVEKLADTCDAIFIMAYDFHRPDSERAGPVAPIGGIGRFEYDINTMLKDYLNKVPAKKLLLGVPYYGYDWVTTTETNYPERIPGSDETGYSESSAYIDIMNTILEYQPNIKWDTLAQAPYFSYNDNETGSNRTVYFENKESLQIKYKLAKNFGLSGIGIWALGYDGGYTELWDLIYDEFVKSD